MDDILALKKGTEKEKNGIIVILTIVNSSVVYQCLKKCCLFCVLFLSGISETAYFPSSLALCINDWMSSLIFSLQADFAATTFS